MIDKRTLCDNLLLLTDHEREEIDEHGYHITIRPVYEWSLGLGE